MQASALPSLAIDIGTSPVSARVSIQLLADPHPSRNDDLQGKPTTMYSLMIYQPSLPAALAWISCAAQLLYLCVDR